LVSRIALVTGAGSGIGRASALALHESGFEIVLVGRRAEALEQTRALAARSDRELVAIPTDITDPQEVRALFDEIERRYGRLDLLFNNAGTNVPSVPIEELPLQTWQAILNVNLTGAFLCAQAAFRLMKRQDPRGGRIINNGSVAASAPRPDNLPYTVSKHGMTGLTRSLSLDGRKYDIACGQIDIGNAASEMPDRMAKGVRQASGEEAVEPRIDLRHVADGIVYMANLPLGANVLFMTVMATAMPLVGRG
jgi:NAD(P)-dependent dehydrogenase (short-subunit alcohol dehydrogenase family)